ncbi:hypothetical protein Tco_1556337, partial [Tanacetum coccineum]
KHTPYLKILKNSRPLSDFEEYTVSTSVYTSYIILLGINLHKRIDQGWGSTSGIRAFALRNFDPEVIEFETIQNNTTTKLPILKLGEYEMWEMRIQQYFQVQDYALWEVIENGNSWVFVPQTSQEEGASVTKMSVPVTAEENINKKNDVKARSLLLTALPNEHQLTFSQYTDAKTMYVAIKTRFGGNETTKKTHKALLKQQYENFNASSSESLDSIFNRLHKLVSRLAILGVIITPEDLNSKFLRSLPLEWNTHVVAWMNKADIETMSIDDLYNNFKIVEQEVRKSIGASTGTQNMAFMTTPSTSSTNEVNTANSASKVSIVSPNVNTASSSLSTANISDDVVYAFMVANPNGSTLLQQDLEQIHEDDLEAMDLKWQLSLLSMRAKRYFQRSGKKIFINANDTAGYDKSKSDMAEEQVQTNMALMAFSDSEVYTDKSCSKTCLSNYATLKKQCDDLIVKLNDTEFKATTYKRGLATVEEQLVTFRKNEVLFSEEIAVLKREVGCKNYEIDKLLESQITDKSKKGLGYHVVAPPHPLSLNAPTKLDLFYSGLDEFKEPEYNGYGPRDTVLKSTIDFDQESDNSKENTDDSVEKDQLSDNENSSDESSPNVVKETVFHTAKKLEFVKPRNNEKPVKKKVRYVEMYRSQVLEGIREIGMGNPQLNDKGFDAERLSKAACLDLRGGFSLHVLSVLVIHHITNALAIPEQTAPGKEISNPLMAGFCDKHNMVAFLQKPDGSEEFHQIVDFLADSHIRYALTTNPTNYVSLVEQFWQTANVETLNDGEQQITVTVDEHNFAITEASVMRHLQLADVDEYVAPTLTNKLFSNMKIGFTGVHVPLFDTMLLHDQPEHSTQQPTSEPTSPTSPPSTEPQLQDTTSSMPYDSPLPGGHTPGSVEGSIKLTKLTDLYTKLVERVTSLETELTKTKKSRIVLSDEGENLVLEAPSKQGRMEEQEVEGVHEKEQEVEYHFDQTLLQHEMTYLKDQSVQDQSTSSFEADVSLLSATKILAEASTEKLKTYKKRRSLKVGTAEGTAKGIFSTAEDIQGTDEEIARKVQEEEQAKAMEQQEQERRDLEVAKELQRQLDQG